MADDFFKGTLLMDETTGKINVPLSNSSFDGTALTKRKTVSVSSPGTPEVVFDRPGTLLRIFATNEDVSEHKFYLYDDVTKIGTIFMKVGESKLVELKIPITTNFRIDSDSSTPIATVVYR